LHLAGKGGGSRRSDFKQVLAAAKQMLHTALMAGAEKFVRLRFTLHLLVHCMFNKSPTSPSVLWTNGARVFVKAIVMVIIDVSLDEAAFLPSTDSVVGDPQFLSDL
jgi:hypothetical protein